MCSLTGSTIICCRSLFKLAVWCCPLPQPPRIIHCWCLNLPFQCWLSFNSYPRLCVSICYIVKLSIDILWCSFHGRAINQYNSIFCLCHCWLNWNCSNQFGVKDWDHTVTIIGPSSGETVLLWFVWWLGKIIVYHSWGWFVTYQSRRTWLGDDHP